MAHVTLDFRSAYLLKSTTVHVLLPDLPRTGPRFSDPKEFYSSGKKFPVLWVLHGGSDDSSDWVRLTNIELYARERDIIVVFPDAGNSFYANWKQAMIQFNMYDYLTEELMPLIHNWFPASSDPKDNFIVGQSMGGVGVAKYVANHPELFGGAGILSVGIPDLDESDRGFLTKNIVTQLSRANGGLEEAKAGPDNIRAALVRNKDKLPPIYCSIGTADPHYEEMYIPFRDFCIENGIKAEFKEYEGYGHEWRIWDIEIQRMMDLFGLKQVRGNS
ncbi:MAG: hypothetical protein IJH41_01375 [Eubacterium sp.]|nr:hypothetical protein [Eubacterium sp.]MBQ3412947.1 hypothetical protein [Oscillospiraceae bacterium]